MDQYIWHEIMQTDSNDGANLFSKPVWEAFLYAPVAKNKNKLGVRTDLPNLGSAPKSENLSTLGLYWTVNKTIQSFLLVIIQKPLTRRFQNTP